MKNNIGYTTITSPTRSMKFAMTKVIVYFFSVNGTKKIIHISIINKITHYYIFTKQKIKLITRINNLLIFIINNVLLVN